MAAANAFWLLCPTAPTRPRTVGPHVPQGVFVGVPPLTGGTRFAHGEVTTEMSPRLTT
jgi:hypothetical protein